MSRRDRRSAVWGLVAEESNLRALQLRQRQTETTPASTRRDADPALLRYAEMQRRSDGTKGISTSDHDSKEHAAVVGPRAVWLDSTMLAARRSPTPRALSCISRRPAVPARFVRNPRSNNRSAAVKLSPAKRAYSKPNRAITPGRKFSTKTSLWYTNALIAAPASALFRSSTRLFLPALSWPNEVEAPYGSWVRVWIMSPSSCISILMTSAPRSANIRVQCGPAMVVVKSRTLRPEMPAA